MPIESNRNRSCLLFMDRNVLLYYKGYNLKLFITTALLFLLQEELLIVVDRK